MSPLMPSSGVEPAVKPPRCWPMPVGGRGLDASRISAGSYREGPGRAVSEALGINCLQPCDRGGFGISPRGHSKAARRLRLYCPTTNQTRHPGRTMVFVNLSTTSAARNDFVASDVRWLESTRHRRLGRRALDPGCPGRNTIKYGDYGGADLSANFSLGSRYSPVSLGAFGKCRVDRGTIAAVSRSVPGRQCLSRRGSQRLHGASGKDFGTSGFFLVKKQMIAKQLLFHHSSFIIQTYHERRSEPYPGRRARQPLGSDEQAR